MVDTDRLLKSLVRRTVAIAGIAVALGTTADASDGMNYCRPFHPSIFYLEIELPKSLHGIAHKSIFDGVQANSDAMKLAIANSPPTVEYSAAAVKFATIASFVEQMALAVVAKDDPLLNSLRVTPLKLSVRDALGFGAKGSRLLEPGEGLPDYSAIELEIADVDTPTAGVDEAKKFIIDRGLVDLIVAGAVDRTFGGVEGFKLHIQEILALTDAPAGITVDPKTTDMRRYVSPTVSEARPDAFPIGRLIEKAFNADKGARLW